MMPRSRQLSATLVLFCVLVGACGGDDDPQADPQPTTTAPSTTADPGAEDEAALRQLAEDWYFTSRSAYLEADFDLDEVAAYLADPYLAAFLDQVETYRQQGRTSEAGEASRHVIERVEVDGGAGEVTECIVDGEVLLDEDGVVINDAVVTTRVRTAALRTDDGWRLNEREALDENEAGDTCDE